MEKPTGRHRKPVRGWGQRVRWLFGAVLAAVLCSPLEVAPRRNIDRPRDEGWLVLERRATPRAIPGSSHEARCRRPDVLGAVGNEPKPGPGPVPVPRPRRPHPSEQQGWCVDNDGVRGVRPYLFHGPERVDAVSAHTTVAEAPGEFDDLAAAVRTWLSLPTT
ncbi:hypothetical protein GCM10007079_47110 [Nocardiopsis terrae]|uniref:Uncharacterized protein n=1 Tax=Nocardiopsis terrae TaxID=372655 RepID=A0ABR9HKH8_9ACTN|nr:hypothetical protein [Nocardiopsis terrae]MBE1459478.1 hypothetical protein [Nocardiopsis terrae]GHC95429.1 hypothetical protein GCM10007079_47110 [Nocardiopsis terrae]